MSAHILRVRLDRTSSVAFEASFSSKDMSEDFAKTLHLIDGVIAGSIRATKHSVCFEIEKEFIANQVICEVCTEMGILAANYSESGFVPQFDYHDATVDS